MLVLFYSLLSGLGILAARKRKPRYQLSVYSDLAGAWEVYRVYPGYRRGDALADAAWLRSRGREVFLADLEAATGKKGSP